MIEVHVVDSFTDAVFKGNPAGVVILLSDRDPSWMQSVAAEMRHSETVFVSLSDLRQEEAIPLRWFTPEVEVNLCGHATLAATHVLGGRREFITQRGDRLTCEARDGWVEMDFPADPLVPIPEPERLGEYFHGVTVKSAGRGKDDVLVQVSDEQEVRHFAPDFGRLSSLSEEFSARGVIVTARGEGDCSFVSRCFYPAVGVPEDPVTGSAHCTLASWWSPILGATEMLAEQVSSRGGRIRLRLEGDRVHLGGQAVSVLRGELFA